MVPAAPLFPFAPDLSIVTPGTAASRRAFLGAGVAAAAALAVPATASAATSADGLRAAVLEFRDPWTQSTGLAELLRRAGFTVVTLDPAKSATEQGVDLIAFGTFTNNAPTYGSYLQTHTASLRAFVAAGGVVLDMAQSDQFNPSVEYLPVPLVATRNDADYDTIYKLADTHPLVDGWTG